MIYWNMQLVLIMINSTGIYWGSISGRALAGGSAHLGEYASLVALPGTRGTRVEVDQRLLEERSERRKLDETGAFWW